MAKKQIAFRLDEEVSQQLLIYAIKHKTSVQEILETYILKLLENG